MESKKTYYRVLAIAGSDSGGGAGIQADIKTLSACGCYASTAITSITVQNTLGVSDVHAIPASIVEKQMESVLSDIGTDAVKIGMLHSQDVILSVCKILKERNVKNIVLDPVMVSTSGHKLLTDEALYCLKDQLLPLARVITPNVPETEVLLGRSITQQKELAECAKALSMNGTVSVYLKGGHLEGKYLTDVFFNAEKQEVIELKSQRYVSKNTHGTGCTLSSAFAGMLARNFDLNNSAKRAKYYISKAIEKGARYQLGKGHGPVHHFYQFWE